jgi:hypothetical protein
MGEYLKIHEPVLSMFSIESVDKILIKGTSYLKEWLKINILKTPLNENRKSVGHRVFSG